MPTFCACRSPGRSADSFTLFEGFRTSGSALPVLQGAAVAAVLCALQQQASRAPPDPTGSGSDAQPWPPLRFAVLCSGFASPCPKHQRLLAAEAPLQLPSLHIYGAQRHADRQARSRFGISKTCLVLWVCQSSDQHTPAGASLT